VKNISRNRCAPVCCAGATAVLLASVASAARADTFGAQLTGGIGEHGVKQVDVGFMWDPGIQWWYVRGWHFSLVGEAHVGYWHTNQGPSNNNVFGLGVTPIVRFIQDTGEIRPYIEVGAGVRGLTHANINENYSLGTAFGFTLVGGVGLQFGSRQQYQVGLRYQHTSNGGIKEPNPGIDFTQLYVQYNF